MVKKKNNLALFSRFNIAVLSVSTLVLIGGSLLPGVRNVVLADQYDAQIRALQNQNANTQSTINGLASQASSYQDAINQLQTQIDGLQASINANLAEQASLKQQIIDAQNEIDKQRGILANDVRAMYVDGTPSTIEMLASSKNLSDFVDKQEYRSAVQSKLQDTLKKIAALQKQLQDKKSKVDELLIELTSQQTALHAAQSQQASLLAYNQSQQASYSAQLAANNSQINTLRAQQAAAIAAATGSGGSSPVGGSVHYKNMTGPQECGGGYEYCYNSDGSYTYLDQFVYDPWGFYNARECAHFVVDALHVRGYYVGGQWPGGAGNANRWVGYTTSAGLATLVGSPQANDVVYIPIGSLGHVAIVDWVNGDGSVHVSQFNWYSGRYNTMDLYLDSPGIQFLRFHH